MGYDVNPLAVTMHLRELDRLAVPGRRASQKAITAPGQTRALLELLLQRVRDRLGSWLREGLLLAGGS